jgi:glutaredoxin-related protein
MSSFSNKINNDDIIFRLNGESSILGRKGEIESPEEGFSSELTSALNELSKQNYSDKLREDAISNGKAIIKNWTPPTNDQIDKIFMNMKKELLA